MDPLHDFDADLHWVFDACRDYIAAYPPEFHEAAYHYLERYNVFREDFNRNYIFYVLPFWLGDAFGIDRMICRKLSLASLLNFFYILTQDAVMDTGPGEYKAGLLPLGTLFYLDALQLYQELFPGDPLFWNSLKKYFREWADGVRWERDECWTRRRMMDEADFTRIAQRAAPVKIINAAMGILHGKPEIIERLDSMVDKILVTSQFLDDCADWREDLQSGNCTYVLALAMKYHNLSDFAMLTDSFVTSAVYFGGIYREIVAVAEKEHTAIKGEGGSLAPYLVVFHETLLSYFHDLWEQIQEQKKFWLAGGLIGWRSINDGKN